MSTSPSRAVVLVGIFDWLFGSKLSADEREQVIEYLTTEWRLRAKQDDQANDYNRVMAQWGGRLGSDRDAASSCATAAERMASVNQGLVVEHGDLGPIPDAAGRCYFGWHSTYLALAEWSDAAARSFRGLAGDSAPSEVNVAQFEFSAARAADLLRAQEKTRREAEKAEARLLKRARITAEEVRQIMRESEGLS